MNDSVNPPSPILIDPSWDSSTPHDDTNEIEQDDNQSHRIHLSRHQDDDSSDSQESTMLRNAFLAGDDNVVAPRKKFSGHCNIETIKDVGFYGLHDEYIVSGSDDGHLFIWDKETSKIVQILHADEDVVNVVKGHPFLPILAASGIDSTVKIFSPTSRPPSSSRIAKPNSPNSYSTSSHMYEEENIVDRNRENNQTMSANALMVSIYTGFFLNQSISPYFTDTDEDEEE